MAGNENSGGNRPDSPQNKFGVSANGGAGSKDGQPNMEQNWQKQKEHQHLIWVLSELY